jgi:hypothetical protein
MHVEYFDENKFRGVTFLGIMKVRFFLDFCWKVNSILENLVNAMKIIIGKAIH